MTRAWPALFAWGAGLLHLAIGAAVVGAQDAAPLAVLAGLVVLGVIELVWGVAVLRAGRTGAARSAVGAAVVALVLGGGALLIGASPIAVAAASALAVSGSALASRSRRRIRLRRPRAPALGLVLGALVVAGIATPALATTEAGLHAVPHGEHGLFDSGHDRH